MKKPNEISYTKDDLQTYKALQIKTNAHIRYSSESGQIIGNKGYKYKDIIYKFFNQVGSGVQTNFNLQSMEVSNNQKDCIYWDDRLKHLMASQQAGAGNHFNEISSIIDELKDADIIE